MISLAKTGGALDKVEIITTHTNTDMDGLAAMVAAQKLYPNACLVFPGKLSQNVEEFVSLHKDTLNIKTVKDIDLGKIKKVILVDTKNPRRLGKIAEVINLPGVEVHLYDHHPWAEGDIRGKVEVVDTVGATVTLLVEKIKEASIPLTPLEATILALGIYGDTGSLLFTNTTPRDVTAVAFLLENKANLAVVNDFLSRPMTEEQKSLLKELLISAERHVVKGIRILIARARVDEFVGGLAILTHTIAEIEKLDAVFTVVEMEDRVHVVGRSSLPQVDVREILSHFKGGGHAAAASATVKAGVEEVSRRLLEIIYRSVKPPLTAADIMSSPVKTVTPSTSIDEAGQVMLRYGHSGLPVVEGERLVGVISRRDVEKAAHHNLGHAPVKGFMTVDVKTVAPDVPVAEVQRIMIENDIGRVPVVEKGKLVGIVSRTDVLRTLHGEFPTRHRLVYNDGLRTGYEQNISEIMRKGLAPSVWSVMHQAGSIADRMGYRVYAAGGIVRDILLGVENLDVDLVVEGDGIALAEALGQVYGVRVRKHQQFGTAELVFLDGFKVDVATARVEFYEYPAALPQVESSTVRHDLYRRDFTFNAMAVSLNTEQFGRLVDYFGGREDLQHGLVRVLHNLSFIEDPIRILRAIRFEQRYGMQIEPQTLKLIEEAVHQGVLSRVSNERLWLELKRILLEPMAGRMLARMKDLQIWPFLFPGVVYWEVQPVLEDLHEAIELLDNWGYLDNAEKWLPYLIAVLHWSDRETAEKICERYSLSQKQSEKVLSTLSGWRGVLGLFRQAREAQPSELAGAIMALPVESYPLLLTLLEEEWARDRFRELLQLIRRNRPSVNGSYIKSLGYRPGPIYREVLEAVWKARLDGKLRDEAEEKEFVREYLKLKERNDV